jgi:hypothetical protein
MMFLLSFLALPTTTDMLAEIGKSSSPIFNELSPLGWAALGMSVGPLILVFIYKTFMSAFTKISFKNSNVDPFEEKIRILKADREKYARMTPIYKAANKKYGDYHYWEKNK